MIKVNKDLADIPSSLRVPIDDFFPYGIPSPPKTTHAKRLYLIKQKKYIDVDVYNERYKLKDIKVALNKIYKNKCAYCEQIVEQCNVEHYRPKRTYYWLAYSWDNLLFACSCCNQYKGSNFELLGQQWLFEETEENIKNINTSSTKYDRFEHPKMINPEVTDPAEKIQFHKNGDIESVNERFAYTIQKCQIDRKPLKDARRTLLNDFREDVTAILTESTTEHTQGIKLEAIIEKFIREAFTDTKQFLAFRRYAIYNEWLNDIISEVKSVLDN